MATYTTFPDPAKTLEHIDRLRRHHDHLKSLDDAYALMRQKETYDRMRDPGFRCDPARMKDLDRSHFTSLILKLSVEDGRQFFAGVRKCYEKLGELLHRFDPGATVEIYLDSAHITVKSLQDGLRQNAENLRHYLPIVAPIVSKWINLIGGDTSLHAVGFFTNLHPAKGLSVGLRFYPSLPLIQIIRGEVGVALYGHGGGLPLRAEDSFHTMLTHSTAFRARTLSFPMSADFVQEFETIIASYDQRVFGVIEDIQVGDFYVRNGYSDKLVAVDEIPVSNGG
ncbi:MAG TPA: hypothetical protein VHC97_24690 [Thermoanaerobaculia bacterium]|jgi:hypothetical protein|nr:hypothetical protein [Thermoanaerobaculia bacterium]